MLRLLVLVLTVSTMGRGVAAAQEAGTPTPACGATAATPSPVDADRVRLVVEARPPANVRVAPETICIARDAMVARLDAAGVAATVDIVDDYGITVDVTITADLAFVTEQVTRVGLLEIVDPRGVPLAVESLVTTSLGGPDTALPPSAYDGEAVDDGAYETIVAGGDIEDAQIVRDPVGGPSAAFTLTDEARERFDAFTGTHIGEPLAIVLDKRVISTPTIQDAIPGAVVISGLFSEDEVEALVASLSSEPMPIPFEVVAVDGVPVVPDGTPIASIS